MLGERIVAMGVEACRDEHELGLERPHRRLDDVLECARVLLVARPGRERDVERRLGLLVRPAGAGVERPLVQRDEEDGRVVPEDRLRPVPVMDVPVDDRDPSDAAARPARDGLRSRRC